MDQITLDTSNLWWVVPLMIWSFAWKAMALWKSARNNDLAWFVIVILINTVGVLEILYIFVLAKSQNKTQK